MLEIMSQYAVARTDYLTEKEVFTGEILGRSGSANKLQREQSDLIRARFNRDLRDIKSWMEEKVKNDPFDMFALAVACLDVAVNRPSKTTAGPRGDPIRSFGWFAAGMCMPELVRDACKVSVPEEG